MKHVAWILSAWAFVPFLCSKNILSPCTNSVLDTRQAHHYAPSLQSSKADFWFFITRIAMLPSLGGHMEYSECHIWDILIVNAQDTEKEQAETLDL